MRCLPDCSGCERPSLQPFVEHLNRVRGENYQFLECLEKLYRNSPQPEMMFKDSKTSKTLVIERKQIVYPEDYPGRHRNDHLLADTVESVVKPSLSSGVFRLCLPYLVRGTRDEIRKVGLSIGNEIKVNLPRAISGKTVGSATQVGSWSFRMLSRFEVGTTEHTPGFLVEWDCGELPNSQERENIRNFVVVTLAKYLASCRDKFRNYSSSLKVLLLELIGDIQLLEEDFPEIIGEVGSVAPTDELWLADYDWISEEERDWNFEMIFQSNTSVDTDIPLSSKP